LYSNLTKHFPRYFKIKGKYFLKICFIIVQHILQTSAIRNKTYKSSPYSFPWSFLPIPIDLQVSSGQFQQSLSIQSLSICRHVHLYYKQSTWVERTENMSVICWSLQQTTAAADRQYCSPWVIAQSYTQYIHIHTVQSVRQMHTQLHCIQNFLLLWKEDAWTQIIPTNWVLYILYYIFYTWLPTVIYCEMYILPLPRTM
jgi:hypothetical protein